MAGISVRKLEDDVVCRLKVLAAQDNVSMEEEVRIILRRAVSAPRNLGELAVQIFGPEHGVELVIPKHSPHKPVDFS